MSRSTVRAREEGGIRDGRIGRGLGRVCTGGKRHDANDCEPASVWRLLGAETTALVPRPHGRRLPRLTGLGWDSLWDGVPSCLHLDAVASGLPVRQ